MTFWKWLTLLHSLHGSLTPVDAARRTPASAWEQWIANSSNLPQPTVSPPQFIDNAPVAQRPRAHVASSTRNAEANSPRIDPAFLRKLQARIVKGETATSILPYIVAFSKSYSGKDDIGCGGTILSPSHVLTAAHCKIEDYYAMGGFLKTTDPSDAQIRVVVELRRDPKRPHKDISRGSSPEFDFMIAVVEPPFDLGTILKAAKLPTAKAHTYGSGTVYGWGKQLHRDIANNAPSLKKAQVDIHSQCKTPHGPSQFCAEGKDGADSCSNDSGGPLMQTDSDVVLGIVSWGRGCSGDGYYTEVFDLVDFLQEAILVPPSKYLGFLPRSITLPFIGLTQVKIVLLGVLFIITFSLVLVLLEPPSGKTRPSSHPAAASARPPTFSHPTTFSRPTKFSHPKTFSRPQRPFRPQRPSRPQTPRRKQKPSRPQTPRPHRRHQAPARKRRPQKRVIKKG